MSDVTERITTYLINGGAFNPELADHRAVRDLLIDARAELAAARKQAAQIFIDSGERISAAEAENERLRTGRDALRAKLDAERDNNKSLNKHLTRAQGNTQKMKAERDALGAELAALRALLRKARKELRQIEADCEADYPPSPGALKYGIRDVLKMIKGGGDE